MGKQVSSAFHFTKSNHNICLAQSIFTLGEGSKIGGGRLIYSQFRRSFDQLTRTNVFVSPKQKKSSKTFIDRFYEVRASRAELKSPKVGENFRTLYLNTSVLKMKAPLSIWAARKGQKAKIKYINVELCAWHQKKKADQRNLILRSVLCSDNHLTFQPRRNWLY